MSSSVEELCDTLQARLTRAGIDAETIERRPDSTIVPNDAGVDAASERAMALLDELGASTLERKLELHGTIGEGGMGIVRLATQRALAREVAVKTIKDEHKSDRTLLKLLREAWVTGGLEHPNVVPVYDIALDGDGAPLIVLKKIEGVDWGSLMHDATGVRERFGADDLLEWNLRTFLSVCNAVRFAHSRGVLHRDLKPENVMVGQFGEVYLVDWGIAVSLQEDGSGRLPLASDAREMAGTPVYMAPEMLGGSGSRLSERTDIYLLGAILHEIVMGEPPHRGESFMALVASIALSEPELKESVPEELSRILRRAMHRDPDARFENVEQVRLAVQAFLHHRDAARLAARAEERMEELVARIGRAASIEDREAVYHLFGECRFGFRHALEVWPGNDAARVGLDSAIRAMVEHELALGEPDAARKLLAEMEAAPPELTQRVEVARDRKAQEEAGLRKLQEDLDPTHGRRTRVFLTTVMGFLWTLLPLAAGAHWSRVEGFAWSGIAISVVFMAMIFGFVWWARESMMRTAINRRMVLAGFLAVGLQLVARLVALKTGDALLETFHEGFLVWTGLVVMLASATDWRLLVSAAGYLAAYVIVPFVGLEHVHFALSASNAVLMLNAVLLWLRPSEDMARMSGRRRLR